MSNRLLIKDTKIKVFLLKVLLFIHKVKVHVIKIIKEMITKAIVIKESLIIIKKLLCLNIHLLLLSRWYVIQNQSALEKMNAVNHLLPVHLLNLNL